jgi:hypothetical protein
VQADWIAAQHGRLTVAGDAIGAVGDPRPAGAIRGMRRTIPPSCEPALRRSSADRPAMPRVSVWCGRERSSQRRRGNAAVDPAVITAALLAPGRSREGQSPGRGVAAVSQTVAACEWHRGGRHVSFALPSTRIATAPASAQTARNTDPGHGSTEHRSACVYPAIRAPACYRLAVLAGPSAAITSARHPRTLPSAQAQILRPYF